MSEPGIPTPDRTPIEAGFRAADDAGYRAADDGCVAIDRSEVGKLAISGLDAVGFLQAHLTVDMTTIAVGAGRAGAILTPKGSLLGVVRVLRGRSALHLDCERAALEGVFRSLHRGRIGWQVELGKRTLQLGQLALVGPDARATAGLAADDPEHHHRVVRIGRVPALAIATPGGADLRCAIDRLPALIGALEAAGAVHADPGLWDVLCVEAGRARFGAELDERTLPAEVGLVPDVVALDKPLYPGMQTVLRQQRSGTVHRALRGLRLASLVAPDDAVVAEDGVAVGRIGTAVVSPARGPIALAVLRRSAEPGSRVLIGASAVVGEVVALPWAAAGGAAAGG